ncbi:MAG: 30S ribosomal protein S6 [Bryobacterales bacterium]|nr:30S ribosomal protein S6 [Bryobacterales bacterium]
MRVYEEMFVLKPDVTEEDMEAVIELVRSTITASGGTVDKVDKWGKRRLAYKVRKYSEGIYILFVFSAKAETVKEVERRLRVSDPVIKFLTVRIDEKLKWLEKRKKIREKRAARKPVIAPAAANPTPAAPLPGAPPAPAPGAPVPAAPATPAPATVAPEAPAESAPEAPAQ